VNIRLIGSVLETENMGNDSDETGVIGAKEQQLEWEEDATSNLPSDINLWEDTDDTDGY
jgi:hypothetical protein